MIKAIELEDLDGQCQTQNMDYLSLDLEDIIKRLDKTIVVLDDDPTGTQTVKDVNILTQWGVEVLERELASQPRMFFILTNSRSLSAADTVTLHKEIVTNLFEASRNTNRDILLVSRSDSTLRGHFPLETETIRQTWEALSSQPQDGEIICPFFREGGRFTADNIHYVYENSSLIPVAETEYALGKTFGFSNSHLGKWIEEKTCGYYLEEDVIYISIDDLRSENGERIVFEKCMQTTNFQKVVVNAISYRDLIAFVIPLFKAIEKGKHFIFRTAASILKVMINCPQNTVVSSESLITSDHQNGGIVIVGSHVDKTSRQLKILLEQGEVTPLEFNQHLVLDKDLFDAEISRVSQSANEYISQGKTVVIYTRRERLDLGGTDKEAELSLARQISDGLIRIFSNLSIRPKFVIAKGGITSSDVATKGLSIARAKVLGQILPGVPIWQTGEECKFSNMSYVVFPGNVGSDDGLLIAVNKFMLAD